MTTQEDNTVKEVELDAVATQAQIEDSGEATNTQEDYDNLLAEKLKLEADKENYRKAALKYKKEAKQSMINLDDEDEIDTEVKGTTSKSFTADEVQEIATKATKAALEVERSNSENLKKVNLELKRSLTGKAPTNGTSGAGSVDTTKTDTPYFNDAQKAFLKTLGVTEEEVLKTKERNRNFIQPVVD